MDGAVSVNDMLLLRAPQASLVAAAPALFKHAQAWDPAQLPASLGHGFHPYGQTSSLVGPVAGCDTGLR